MLILVFVTKYEAASHIWGTSQRVFEICNTGLHETQETDPYSSQEM